MNSQTDTVPMDRFEAELMHLVEVPGAAPAVHALARSWRGLRAELLPLEREPRRDCPVCGKSGMAAATRCGFCWSSLTPVELLPPRKNATASVAARDFENEGGARSL